MMIRRWETNDLPEIIQIWNQSVESGEVLNYPLTADYFHTKFEMDPNYDPELFLVAEDGGRIVGFIGGTAKKIFLDHENNETTPGYLTCLFVREECRGRGIGRLLADALCGRFRAMGKAVTAVRDANPIQMDWRIPGTPGHDHNNMPGVDTESPGYGFLRAIGFHETDREVAMYLNLRDYVPWEGLKRKQEELLAQGIYTGPYDAALDYDYDRACDRVKSDYWRESIRSEITCWKENRPNTDTRFIPNGTQIPAGPRTMLVATHDRHIVAFTGPVDKQQSGRGWFTGIFTDPEFEHRGIAPVLFNLLMQEFIAEGAAFSTLFTGGDNRAQRIYLRTGFRPVRTFAVMEKDLKSNFPG
ncbi:MAG: GNAT family N-acetyltransferase [Clostridia bacterium]|nr:GNAT family N-acetyltransferase [Clostridia bacterium]